MAKCDEGYRCEVCGRDVESIIDSDLYLRYVLGFVDSETLHTTPERHLRCNPSLAQFIIDKRFEPVSVDGPADKRKLDPAFVTSREDRVTRAYRRLHELVGREGVSLLEYPLDSPGTDEPPESGE